MSFGTQAVGTTSAAKTTTLFNTGTATMTVSSISVSANFAQTNTCGASLAAGKNCKISVTFSPTATGKYTGTLTVSDNANNSPQICTLNGTGK